MANPFAASNDPFGQSTSNPFAAVPNDNPFAANQAGYEPVSAAPAPAPAKSKSPFTATSAPAPVGGAVMSGERALRDKEEALARKEAELEARERELEKREAAGGGRPPNWPICRPFMYHSIKDEIPAHLQSLVRAAYFAWIGYAVCQGVNLFTLLAWWFAPKTNSDPGDFVAAMFWAGFGIPTSFMWSYMSCYNGARKKSASSLLWFCISWGMTIGIMILMFVGVPGVGSAGLIMLIDASKDDEFVTIMAGISMALWGTNAIYSSYVFKRVWSFYSDAGGIKQARKEVNSAAAQEVAKQALADQAA
eukprot:TRINITY_DN3715_c0_g1_i1.p1 TRINITY_DN3715_c0_g1~~TRINITY_DN3715_c0_g1_i1.p1  ORF type:complete len:338 (-),score=80.69 TRINITY_DN3715_c0_g1_i1:46-963(-)